MSDYRTPRLPRVLVAVVAMGITATAAETTVGTAFTYQGQLKNAGVPYTGEADFQFTLWDAATAGATLGEPVRVRTMVENGLFQAELDFGLAPFQRGQAVWLEVTVETALGGARLEPRQNITPAPFALHALSGPPSSNGSGLTLPFTGVADSSDVAFAVGQGGLAGAASFAITNVDSTQATVNAVNFGTGPSVLALGSKGRAGHFSVGGDLARQQSTVYVENSAGGIAGQFACTRDGNLSPAILAENNATGSAAKFNTGFDPDPEAGNDAPTVVSENHAWGSAGRFSIQNDANTDDALWASTNGTGTAILGSTVGMGPAGKFVIANIDNASAAMTGETNGSGEAVHGVTAGSGRAGFFEVDNIGARSLPALEASTNARGGGAGLFRTTNGLNTEAALTAETNGNNIAVLGHARGMGDAVHGYNAFGGNAVRGLVEAQTGKAGSFEITEPDNSQAAIEGKTAGTGAAGYFENLQTSGRPKALHAKSNASIGWGGYFEGDGYFSKRVGIATETTNAKLQIADDEDGLAILRAGETFNVFRDHATLHGPMTATQFKFATPPTYYHSLGPTDFIADQPTDISFTGPGWESKSGDFITAYAPVHLPHRARVKKATVYYYDPASGNLNIKLTSLGLANGVPTELFFVNSTGSGGYGSVVHEFTYDGGLLINNSAHAYHIEAWAIDQDCGTIDPCDWLDGVDIMGVTFEYTLSEAQ